MPPSNFSCPILLIILDDAYRINPEVMPAHSTLFVITHAISDPMFDDSELVNGFVNSILKPD